MRDRWEEAPDPPPATSSRSPSPRQPPEHRQSGHAATAIPWQSGVATVVSVSVLQHSPFPQLGLPRSCFAVLLLRRSSTSESPADSPGTAGSGVRTPRHLNKILGSGGGATKEEAGQARCSAVAAQELSSFRSSPGTPIGAKQCR